MKPKLLLADDSEDKITFIMHGTKRVPVELIIARRTEEAIEIIRQDTTILLGLVDYRIPSQNGPSIIRAWRALEDGGQRKKSRICLETNLLTDANAKEATEAGADECIELRFTDGVSPLEKIELVLCRMREHLIQIGEEAW